MDSFIDNGGDEGESMDASGGPGEIPVSSDAVSVDGTPPEVGDTISFTVEGTVSSVEGDTLMVKPVRVNGSEIPVGGPKPSDRSRLRGMAMAADGAGSMGTF